MKYQMGFIGVGHMGAALAKTAAKGGDPAGIILAGHHPEKTAALAEKLGCSVGTAAEAAAESRFIILGVKPQTMEALFKEISPALKGRGDRFVLVTMAAGISIEKIRALAGGAFPVVRIMPNTPVAAGEGCTLWAKDGVTDGEMADFLSFMAAGGGFVEFPEELINAGSAVSGCGPAFVYLFIEAMKDAAERLGIPEDKALELAERTVFGSAKLALDSGKAPDVLWREVATPGGTTIEGVRALQNGRFAEEVYSAVTASFRRTEELAVDLFVSKATPG